MPNDEDGLLQLVGAIHAAAATPDDTAWPAALARIGDAVGGTGAIVTDHRLPGEIIDIGVARVAPEVPEYILGNYSGPTNPLIANLSVLTPGALLSPTRIIDQDEFNRTEIYAILHGLGVGGMLAAVLDRDAGHAIALSLLRDRAHGPFSAEHEAFLQRLLPHLTAAALVRRRLLAMLATAHAPRQLLAALDRGIVLLDARAHVLYANTLAERLLRRRDGLGIDRGGGLTGARAEDTARLRRLIALAAASGAGHGLQGGGALALARPHGRAYIVRILPLAPGAELGGTLDSAIRPAAALMVRDPDARPRLPERRLQEAYGLSRAEAALAARLVAGEELRQAAMALGIGLNTAKTQLKLVFAKLEVERQAALVRRVLLDLGAGAGEGGEDGP